MWLKLVIIALLLFIVFNLIRAGVVMLKAPDPSVKMSQFLGRRVLFSAIVLIIIFIALALGLIQQNPRPY
ncbi:DUF2909 domain-containing protein [Rheinheimera baltica]|uniref:DUF2909 domain-containing protein n=1 Tax=Rheinheimera baltica TaxID=67576 RepID=A0ABT9I0C2_9GAMM|nr:DUF2909 domain-containing protein [Rheinheimera baltica]MDP5136819.1 DUF2909 domain-containing protein [Rheinheimera baltica]MDP5142259.1 DUF2909 domain-containing protein [Rheinheimera baltica]MDP5150835.1 DUF2909 domain-containing protein [Rheinheimera baltica]MDP5188630.1 DUF2909 domain-containing protein [Rheinheimera baltica]